MYSIFLAINELLLLWQTLMPILSDISYKVK